MSARDRNPDAAVAAQEPAADESNAMPEDANAAADEYYYVDEDYPTFDDDAWYEDGAWDGYDNCDYPLLPVPRYVQPPVVVPPLIARPVTPPAIRWRHTRQGWVAEPNPHIRRWNVPPYPEFQTNGSAYFPTPEYPYPPYPYPWYGHGW